jgi:hypothetical protein
VAQPRRAVATDSCMFPRPRTECASVEHTIGTPASIAALTCTSRRSRRSSTSGTSRSERSRFAPISTKNVFYAAHTDPKVAEALRDTHWYEVREWATTGPGANARPAASLLEPAPGVFHHRGVRSLVALAFGVAAVGFSFAPEAERPTGRFAFVTNATTPAVVVWTVRADGSELRKLTRVRLKAETEPEWSPEGSRIAYSRTHYCPRALDCTAIWTANADGSAQRRLTPSKLTGQLSKRAVDFSQPTWSPDGRRIAYVQSIEATQTSNLWVMNADCSGRRRLTRLRNAGDPAWSPDGNEIAFQHDADIFVLATETGGVRRLTKTVATESLPQWSPDGRRIAYDREAGRSTEYEVFVMNADGTGRRNLSRRRGVVDGSPVWSPGGELIAFVSDRDGDEPAIYITAADGSERAEKVRTPDLALYELDWAPEVR